MTVDVAIIGGGISGLTAAWLLKARGKSVCVLEAKEDVGGNLRTTREAGYAYEQGPHSFMPSSDAVWEMIAALGLEDAVVQAKSASQARYIWKQGRLHPLPMSPGSFLTSGLIGFGAKLRLMMEPLIPGDAHADETAKAFFTRRLGRQAVQWMIGPFVGGIYAGDPEQLGARDAFNKMWNWEKDAGSMILGALRYMKAKAKERGERAKKHGLFSFRGGLGTLTGALAAVLRDEMQTGAVVKSIEKDGDNWRVTLSDGTLLAQKLVLAIPPDGAKRLLAPIDRAAGDLFDAMAMSPVAVVHMGVSGADAAAVPDGFGFLAPRGEGLRMLGCVFTARLFDDRAPAGHQLLSAYIGGVHDPEAVNESDDALLAACVADLEKVLGRTIAPDFVRVLRHPLAIPQLAVGHLDRIVELKRRAEHLGGLVLAGNYLSGVGMNDATASGQAAARQILAADNQASEQRT